MKQAILLAASVALVGCSSHNETRAKEVVRANLTDPDSGKFGRFVEVDSKNRDWACQEVNYKGPAGGYVGMSAARLVKPAGSDAWKFEGIAGTYDDCVTLLHDMQPYEGGAR